MHQPSLPQTISGCSKLAWRKLAWRKLAWRKLAWRKLAWRKLSPPAVHPQMRSVVHRHVNARMAAASTIGDFAQMHGFDAWMHQCTGAK
jgi:hypothetical protein